ncbi:Histidine kinase-, DNA gyrase B-, and HSP90-like ATPase [Sphingobacterium nematocida]|uniref:histidine kinase n=1 Tax=Sphingobacterium nematocida TaxID=1513896 RepID=A0A1T5BIB2_9SPHI|nr:HAMP domain-containing sensor histidine kinase [Sphingobacterium nematocida]SKB46740.1 Histidine kinase-, DNA gyrase B-, and HSP90-like ATPase [Sphingobacterium nematocida]
MGKSSFFFFLKIGLLLIGCIGIAYLLFENRVLYAVLLFFVLFGIAYYWLSVERRLLNYVLDFAEAVRYRDFTRRFVVKNPRTVEGRLFTAFNDINSVYKSISIDKEIQHQYLNKVINMLDSAIIFYEAGSGKVVWINDAFKQLFNTPHLGNIKGLIKRHLELYEKTIGLKVGRQQTETINSIRGKIKLLMNSSEFETQEGLFRIVVCQNINEAIDEAETKAWHKLLRVLTHEIMNSIAPISSLAETLHGRLEMGYKDEDTEDLKVGIHTIKRRSEGLLQFAKSYRMINKVDHPDFKNVLLIDVFEEIYQLLEPTMLQKGIDVDIIIKDTRLLLYADRNLIEQVLINLLLNAMEAVSDCDEPYISITGKVQDGHVRIEVADNGKGMSSEIQEQIFTPFFTTRKTGTGVGLTLSKQIMLVHNGNIMVDSIEGKGSVFTLNF